MKMFAVHFLKNAFLGPYLQMTLKTNHQIFIKIKATVQELVSRHPDKLSAKSWISNFDPTLVVV